MRRLVGARGTEFRILGPLEVRVDGELRPVTGARLQALLARLLLEPNRAVSTERLIDDLWGDEPPATARQSLHVHVARLRRALVANEADDSPLGTDRRGYVLSVDEQLLDATRFRAMLAAARAEANAGRDQSAREQYAEALALWRGPVLDGVSLRAADGHRAELEALRSAALEERIELDLELGHASHLVPELERLVQADPLRERTWTQLMRALYASGRQSDALAAYQDARRALAALGLEPGPALRELEQLILNHDPSLTTSSWRAARHRPRRVRRRAIAVLVALTAAVLVAGVVFLTRDRAPSAAPVATPRSPPNSVVEIDPHTNRVVAATHVGRSPDSIAITDDAVWVANVEDRTVARVSLRTKQVRVVGGVPVAHQIASGLNNDVWLSSFEEPLVTLIARGGRIGGGEIAAGPRRVQLPGSAEGLALGGGYLWVTSPHDSGGRDTIFRIDLRSKRLVSSIPVGSLPLFVTFGYGSAWVSNYRGNSVSVIRPGSRLAETIPVPGGPLGIAAGAGAVWVVTYWNRQLVRIDPETRRVLRRIAVGEGPLSVTTGAGAIWVTNRDSKTVTRVDPTTNRVTATIRLGSAPYGVRFAHGRLWVTTQRCGSPTTVC